MKVLAIALLAVVAAQAGRIPDHIRAQYKNPLERYPIYKELFGDLPKTDSKIVGGEICTPNEFPFLGWKLMDNAYICSLSLLRSQWILTAAHCVDGFRRLDITLGDHSRSNTTEGGEQTFVVNIVLTGANQNVWIREDWNTRNLNNDLALIKLPVPVTLTPQVAPVPAGIPSQNTSPNPYVGKILNLQGWGKPSDLLGPSDVCRKVSIPGMSTAQCQSVYGSDVVTNNVICLDATGGKGSCGGDSGGPLIDPETGMQVGTTSFGASAGCQLNYPVGYTRVSSYSNWIEEIVQNNS